MDFRLRVEDAAFAYLRIQKGNLDELSGNRAAWHKAYEEGLQRQFESFRDYLPEKCERFLDVGSGLGGIDILINRHYESAAQTPALTLLDGESDVPKMNLHRETFNDMRVAREFQRINGGVPRERFHYWTPFTAGAGDGVARYDLVVSFGSWCFHYAPAVYLSQLRRWLKPGAVAVFDVRVNKPEWEKQLLEVFEPVAIVRRQLKYRRAVLRVRQ